MWNKHKTGILLLAVFRSFLFFSKIKIHRACLYIPSFLTLTKSFSSSASEIFLFPIIFVSPLAAHGNLFRAREVLEFVGICWNSSCASDELAKGRDTPLCYSRYKRIQLEKQVGWRAADYGSNGRGWWVGGRGWMFEPWLTTVGKISSFHIAL